MRDRYYPEKVEWAPLDLLRLFFFLEFETYDYYFPTLVLGQFGKLTNRKNPYERHEARDT